MKVILIKDTARLGPKNTILEVSDSYAINVFLKGGMASRLTKSMEDKIVKDKAVKAEKGKADNSKHFELISKLKSIANNNGILFAIKRKADTKSNLYGAITEAEIVDAIFEVSSVSISPKQIDIEVQAKSLGQHVFAIVGNSKSDRSKSEGVEKFRFEVKALK